MFICPNCGKNLFLRSKFLLHVSVCNFVEKDDEKSINDGSDDEFSRLSPLGSSPEFQIGSLPSSPVTEEQVMVAAEAERILSQATLEPTLDDIPVSIIGGSNEDVTHFSFEIIEDLSDNVLESIAIQTMSPTSTDQEMKQIQFASSNQVITPIRNIGGQWVMSSTPKGVHRAVHWQDHQNQENQQQNSTEKSEEVGGAKKRLWIEPVMENQEQNSTEKSEEVGGAKKRLRTEPVMEAAEDSCTGVDNHSNQPLQKDEAAAICPYCGCLMPNSKNFARHLKTKHSSEDTVKLLLKLKTSKSSRREIQKITDGLRKLGRYRFMEKYGPDSIIPTRKSKKENPIVVTCKFCLGGYTSDHFRNHWRSCSQRPADHLQSKILPAPAEIKKKPAKSSKLFSSVVPCSTIGKDDKLKTAQNMIFKTMQMTDVGKQAFKDELIIKFASERLPGTQSDPGKLDYFRQGVRDLSNLLKEIKILDPTISNLTDCFQCSKFPIIMQAVHAISETDFIAGTVKKTSFNNRLRTPLGACCKILLYEARVHLKGKEREERVTELKHFMETLESSWAKQFGTLAENQMKENRHGKVINCADPEDLSMAFNKCEEELPRAIEALKKEPNCKNYENLMRLVALAMYTTSRRRSVDLQKLTKSDFEALQKNVELCVKVGQYLKLSEEIMKRMASLYCIFSCGKDAASTAILLTEDMKTGVECLLGTQQLFQINTKKIFVRLDYEVRPWKVDLALEWAKKVLPLKDPKNFGVRGIRHLTGTLGQVLTEQDPEIESIFREGLSHSEFVSKRYYRGNLASRLIQGYGLPLLDTMKKSKTTCTVTSSDVEETLNNAVSNCDTVHQSENETCQTQIQTKSDALDRFEIQTLSNNECGAATECEPSTDQDEDWIPDSGEEEEWRANLNKTPDKTFLSDKERVVRRKWSEEEDSAIVRQFYKVIKMEKRVTIEEINLALEKEPSLRSRTVAQIRARLSLIRHKQSSSGKELSKLIYKLTSPEAKKFSKL